MILNPENMKGECTLTKKGSRYTGTFMDLFSLSVSWLNNSLCVCLCVLLLSIVVRTVGLLLFCELESLW